MTHENASIILSMENLDQIFKLYVCSFWCDFVKLIVACGKFGAPHDTHTAVIHDQI